MAGLGIADVQAVDAEASSLHAEEAPVAAVWAGGTLRPAAQRAVRTALPGHRRARARPRGARGRLRRRIRHAEDRSRVAADPALGFRPAVHRGVETLRQANGTERSRVLDPSRQT